MLQPMLDGILMKLTYLSYGRKCRDDMIILCIVSGTVCMEMVCVMAQMGNDIVKLRHHGRSDGQLDWIEILSTDENYLSLGSAERGGGQVEPGECRHVGLRQGAGLPRHRARLGLPDGQGQR